MTNAKPGRRSRRPLWVGAAVLSILGGSGYWLFNAVDRVRESAARSS